MLEGFLTAVLINIASDVAKEGIKKGFEYVQIQYPQLAKQAEDAEKSGDKATVEKVFKESVGIIDAAAASGKIEVSNSSLTALNTIQFDHQKGEVIISGTALSSDVLITGGSKDATGKTTISNSTLQSKGTTIRVGKGASIVTTGNAHIKQN